MSIGNGAQAGGVEWYAQRFAGLAGNVESFIQGKPGVVRMALVCIFAERAPADRGRARRRQDVAGQGDRQLDRRDDAAASSSRPTCCPPTSPACRSSTPATREFEFRPGPRVRQHRARPTRSTGRRRRPSRRCSRSWRSTRSPSTARPTAVPRPFMVIATPEPGRARGHVPRCPRPSSTGSYADRRRLPGPRLRNGRGDRRHLRGSLARPSCSPSIDGRRRPDHMVAVGAHRARRPGAAGVHRHDGRRHPHAARVPPRRQPARQPGRGRGGPGAARRRTGRAFVPPTT